MSKTSATTLPAITTFDQAQTMPMKEFTKAHIIVHGVCVMCGLPVPVTGACKKTTKASRAVAMAKLEEVERLEEEHKDALAVPEEENPVNQEKEMENKTTPTSNIPVNAAMTQRPLTTAETTRFCTLCGVGGWSSLVLIKKNGRSIIRAGTKSWSMGKIALKFFENTRVNQVEQAKLLRENLQDNEYCVLWVKFLV